VLLNVCHGLTDRELVKAVQDAYSLKAQQGSDTEYSKRVAHAFGYTPEQLQSIPSESHMGLSCGNPVAAASLKPGERVLDLGSGGGIDVFLAADKVGPQGRAIGLDMSADMIARARKNASNKSLETPQVAFVQCLLTEPLPIRSGTIDCILSNCVINLLPLPGKASLLQETFKVLKPGGRIVLDDIVAKKHLPDDIRSDLAAHVGCIAGAIELDAYKGLIIDAGFQDVVFVDTGGDINIYNTDLQTDSGTFGGCAVGGGQAKENTCCVPKAGGGCAQTIGTGALAAKHDLNEWVASYQIYALKAAATDSDHIATPAQEPILRLSDAYPSA